MRRAVLITGASGYIGTALQQRLGARRDLDLLAFSARLGRGPARVPDADAVVHLAGKLNSFKGSEEELFEANYHGTLSLAQACRRECHFIFLSTDQVFRSDPRRAYTDASPPDPETAYGRSKLMAETYLSDSLKRVTILRTSLVYGLRKPGRTTTVDFIENSLAGGSTVELFADVYSRPTFIGDLCRAIERALDDDVSGTFHVTGPDLLSRYEMGLRVCAARGLNAAQVRPGTRPPDCRIPQYLNLVTSDRFKALVSTTFDQGLLITG